VLQPELLLKVIILHFSREDLSTFKGLKRAVMRIDSNYWRHIRDGKNKLQLTRSLQEPPTRSNRPDPPKSVLTDRNLLFKQFARDRPRLPSLIVPALTQSLSSLAPFLGLDRQLTLVEYQCCLDLGLCIHCGQSGHLAKNCPKQVTRNLPITEACGAIIDFFSLLLESSKNKLAAFPVSRGTTVSLSPGNLY